jgi:hypothetical protein
VAVGVGGMDIGVTQAAGLDHHPHPAGRKVRLRHLLDGEWLAEPIHHGRAVRHQPSFT